MTRVKDKKAHTKEPHCPQQPSAFKTLNFSLISKHLMLLNHKCTHSQKHLSTQDVDI